MKTNKDDGFQISWVFSIKASHSDRKTVVHRTKSILFCELNLMISFIFVTFQDKTIKVWGENKEFKVWFVCFFGSSVVLSVFVLFLFYLENVKGFQVEPIHLLQGFSSQEGSSRVFFFNGNGSNFPKCSPPPPRRTHTISIESYTNFFPLSERFLESFLDIHWFQLCNWVPLRRHLWIGHGSSFSKRVLGPFLEVLRCRVLQQWHRFSQKCKPIDLLGCQIKEGESLENLSVFASGIESLFI